VGRGVGADGQPVTYGVRPGDLLLSSGSGDAVPAEVIVVEPTGNETELLLKAGESQIVLVAHGRPAVEPGVRIGLGIDPASVHLFDQATGRRLNA